MPLSKRKSNVSFKSSASDYGNYIYIVLNMVLLQPLLLIKYSLEGRMIENKFYLMNNRTLPNYFFAVQNLMALKKANILQHTKSFLSDTPQSIKRQNRFRKNTMEKYIPSCGSK